jgi:hypothetical protein
MKRIAQCILYIPLVFFITGCVNLKAVNDYAKSSKETVQAYNQAGILLTDSYKHKARFHCMFSSTGQVNYVDNESQCYNPKDLIRFKKSDSLISVVNTTLEKYFLALEELSNDESSSFELKSDNIKKILSDTTEFKKITDNQISATEGLVNKLTNAAFEVYKKNKLANIILEVHEDLEQVIEMNKTVQNVVTDILLGSKDVSNRLYQNIHGNACSNFDKIKATQDYFEASAHWTNKLSIIEKYIASLTEILNGHKKLKENGKKLKTREIIGYIANHTTKIIEIRNEIIKLKEDE